VAARTHVGCARALIARGRPEDLARTPPMLDQAARAASHLGTEGIARDVAECRAALAAIGSLNS
jgi:hypothetical protein